MLMEIKFIINGIGGDGNYSEWLSPYDSGEICKVAHKWTKRGIYEVKVMAKDEYGMNSNWSKPLIISMPVLNINNSWLEKIIEWIFKTLISLAKSIKIF